MGVDYTWQEDVLLTIKKLQLSAEIIDSHPYLIIDTNQNFLINLVPIINKFNSEELVQLQLKSSSEDKLLIHLWQDVWLSKKNQVLNRLNSFLGLNLTVHGRKAKIEKLTAKVAKDFLNEYHLQGYVKSKFSYGLLIDQELISVASFSEARPMTTKGEDYKSAELIRFATKNGFTIVGGLSKLIKHFLKEVTIDDLMTYADRDWSVGKGYEKLGFTFSGETKPLELFLNPDSFSRSTVNRLPESVATDFKKSGELNFDKFLLSKSYQKVFNTGNLKYHLFL